MTVVNQFFHKRLYSACCVLLILSSKPLNASTLTIAKQSSVPEVTNVKGSEAEIYKPEFFSQYSPQTALNMVTQLPGFNLVETDDDIRGFAAGAGNILIDGRRPTTKSGGIREALSRVPASQVAQIEVIRGASGSADAAGQAVVANIIQIKDQAAKHWEFSTAKTSASLVRNND